MVYFVSKQNTGLFILAQHIADCPEVWCANGNVPSSEPWFPFNAHKP